MVVSRTRRAVAPVGLAAAWLALAACGDPAARVRLVALGGACAQPLDGISVKLTAYAASGERSESIALDETVAIANFPPDTEQIGVEVLVGGGATGAAGKSVPLVYDELADGAAIPVLMAPPNGFCEVGSMTEPRVQPLVARAGDGVLVVGGTGPAGPLSTAEFYDPATATFTAVPVPPVLVDDAQGFAGAALASLPDGRAALIGGPHSAFVVFDAQTRTFATDPALIDARAFHAAIAVGSDEVLIAGGCASVSAQQCAGESRRQMQRYRLSRISTPDPAALLPASANLRIAAQLFDLGVQLDGRRGYLLAGGSGDPGLADRFTLDDAASTTLASGHAQAAALDGGAVLTAFAADSAPAASGGAAVYAPSGGPAHPIASAPELRGARLVGLEDGRVVGIGGDPMGRVVTYDPLADRWIAALPAAPSTGIRPGVFTAPSLVRLADGGVLVVGGALSAQAWVYRPSLIGPASGSVTVVPGSDASRGVLTAPDPSTVTRGMAPTQPAWLLSSATDALTARALVGGPRTVTGSVVATVVVRAGGVALIAQQTGPGRALVARLSPERPPQLVRLDGASERIECSQPPALAAFDPAVAVTVRLAIEDRTARLTIDDREILACEITAGERGAWGIAALGAGAQVQVATVAVAR